MFKFYLLLLSFLKFIVYYPIPTSNSTGDKKFYFCQQTRREPVENVLLAEI